MTRHSILKRKDYLNLLAKSKHKKRRNALIDIADKGEIKALAEILVNVLHGNIQLTKAQKTKLQKYKNVLRQLCTQQCSASKKKEVLKQHGGILGLVLPIAMSLLSGLTGAARA